MWLAVGFNSSGDCSLAGHPVLGAMEYACTYVHTYHLGTHIQTAPYVCSYMEKSHTALYT